jgi:hypothetical protein
MPNKIKSKITYLTTTNYWALLQVKTEEEEKIERMNTVAMEQPI